MSGRPVDAVFDALVEWDLGPAAEVLADRLGAELGPARIQRLVELDEGIWWSQQVQGETRSAVTLVADAVTAAHHADVLPLLCGYLRAVGQRAWELTWDHTAIHRVIVAALRSADTLGLRPENEPSLQLLVLLQTELRVETACSLSSYTEVVETTARGVAICRAIQGAAEQTTGRFLRRYLRVVGGSRASYLEAVGIAAAASLEFLSGGTPTDGNDRLDEAVAALRAAEEDQRKGDESSRTELRAHRVTVQALQGAREVPWLRVDAGRVICLYPFGLRGQTYDDIVAAVRRDGAGWSLVGVPLGNAPTQLLLVDDLWRGDDTLHRSYEGTQLDLPAVLIPPPEGGASIRAEASIVISQLGNHHLRFEIPLVNALPHDVAHRTWLGAPECGRLTELGGRGISLDHDGSPQWDRLSELAATILAGLPVELRKSTLRKGDSMVPMEVEVSARPGMYQVVTLVSSASALPGGRSAEAHPLSSAAEIPTLFGSTLLLHPIPSGIGALSSWTLYEPQGTTIETAALLKELMVVNTNHTLLACLHSPSFMIETVCEAIEFVISLDGLFAAWQDDLSSYYLRLRDQVDEFTEMINATAVDDESQIFVDQIDVLERQQLELRRFTTRARVSLLFVVSPALVTSPVMRRTIDDLLETSSVWQSRQELTDVAEHVLGDRLHTLIESWDRRRAEREDELRRHHQVRSQLIFGTLTAVVAGIGVSGVVSIFQSGYGIEDGGSLGLAALVVVVAAGCGLLFWSSNRTRDRQAIRG